MPLSGVFYAGASQSSRLHLRSFVLSVGSGIAYASVVTFLECGSKAIRGIYSSRNREQWLKQQD
jgi:hypothetical protein